MSMEALQTEDISESRSLKEQGADWAKRAYENLEKLEIPAKIKEEIRQSLETPQLGPYHNEGVEMASHVGRISEVVDQINEGSFKFDEIGLPSDLENDAKNMIERAIKANYSNMQLYALLHDIAKQRCMNIEDSEKKQRVFTLDEWKTLVAENGGDKDKAQTALVEQGYKKIGYRIGKELAATSGGQEKDHGDEAGVMIQELGERDPETKDFAEKNLPLIIKAIQNHELHFQVFNDAKTANRYEKSLKEKFSQEEIDFIYAVCFIDISGSLNKEGKADYSGFKNMVNAKKLYEIIADCGVQNTDALKNLGTENEVLTKITQLKKDEALKKLILGTDDLAAMEGLFDSWGIKSEDDKKLMSEIISKNLGQENPIAVINQSMPNNLKRYTKNLKQYLEVKV